MLSSAFAPSQSDGGERVALQEKKKKVIAMTQLKKAAWAPTGVTLVISTALPSSHPITSVLSDFHFQSPVDRLVSFFLRLFFFTWTIFKAFIEFIIILLP